MASCSPLDIRAMNFVCRTRKSIIDVYYVMMLTVSSTLFHSRDIWPVRDNADPREGWEWKQVHDTSSGPATADIYGKLFYHVRGVLQSFLCRVSDLELSLTLHHLDALELPNYLPVNHFDRVDVRHTPCLLVEVCAYPVWASSVYLGCICSEIRFRGGC